MIKTGCLRNVSLRFSFSTIVIPSTFGITMSKRTISGVVSFIMSMASSPLSAFPMTVSPSSALIISPPHYTGPGVSSPCLRLAQRSRQFNGPFVLISNILYYTGTSCHLAISGSRKFRHIFSCIFGIFRHFVTIFSIIPHISAYLLPKFRILLLDPAQIRALLPPPVFHPAKWEFPTIPERSRR